MWISGMPNDALSGCVLVKESTHKHLPLYLIIVVQPSMNEVHLLECRDIGKPIVVVVHRHVHDATMEHR